MVIYFNYKTTTLKIGKILMLGSGEWGGEGQQRRPAAAWSGGLYRGDEDEEERRSLRSTVLAPSLFLDSAYH